MDRTASSTVVGPVEVSNRPVIVIVDGLRSMLPTSTFSTGSFACACRIQGAHARAATRLCNVCAMIASIRHQFGAFRSSQRRCLDPFLEDRIITPKLKIGWKKPRIHPANLLLVFSSFLLGHAQERIIQKVSHALLNVGGLSVENLEVQVAPVSLPEPQPATVDNVTIRPRMSVELLKFERQAKKPCQCVVVFLVNAFHFRL